MFTCMRYKDMKNGQGSEELARAGEQVNIGKIGESVAVESKQNDLFAANTHKKGVNFGGKIHIATEMKMPRRDQKESDRFSCDAQFSI